MKLDASAISFTVLVKNSPMIACLLIIIVTIYLKLSSFSSVYKVEDNVWFELFLKVSSTLLYIQVRFVTDLVYSIVWMAWEKKAVPLKGCKMRFSKLMFSVELVKFLYEPYRKSENIEVRMGN